MFFSAEQEIQYSHFTQMSLKDELYTFNVRAINKLYIKSAVVAANITVCTTQPQIDSKSDETIMFAFGNLDFFPLILLNDIVSIVESTVILEIFCQGDVKHIMTLPIKPITFDLNVLTYIITSTVIARLMVLSDLMRY